MTIAPQFVCFAMALDANRYRYIRERFAGEVLQYMVQAPFVGTWADLRPKENLEPVRLTLDEALDQAIHG